jgi:hypothetical protein
MSVRQMSQNRVCKAGAPKDVDGPMLDTMRVQLTAQETALAQLTAHEIERVQSTAHATA